MAPNSPNVSVGHVLGRRSIVAAAVSVAAAVVITCAGCGAGSPPKASTRSLVPPTTQIAGAGVLGNDRQPDESCARDAAAADPGPPTRQAHNAAGVTPDVLRVPAEAQRIVVHGRPGVGPRSNPDLNGVAAARPDLILGSQGLTPRLYPQLAAIAPTVFT